MNDDENNPQPQPQPQPWIDPALEARVVALVLGESSAFEAAELERLLADNPELALFKRRIEAVHALVGVAARPENPKIQLSPEHRKKLLETIGVPIVVPDNKIRVVGLPHVPWWSSPLLIRVAACLIMTTLVLAIFSSVTVFRSSSEKPDFEGYSGNSGFVVNVSDAKSPRGVTLSAGAKPQVPAAIDLNAGSLVTTGAATAQPSADLESKKVAVWNQVPAQDSLLAAAPKKRRHVQSWDDDEKTSSVSQNKTPEPVATPEAETLASLDKRVVAIAAKESPAEPLQELAQLAQAVEIEDKLSAVTDENLRVVQQQPAAVADLEQLPNVSQRGATGSQDFAKIDQEKANIAREYLSGVPDTASEASAKPSEAWDSLYMFRGVNVLGRRDSEAKPLPAEVVEEVTKSLVESGGPASNVAVWDGETSVSGSLVAETTGETLRTDGRDGTPLPSVADADQPLVAQANKDAVPLLGDAPLAERLFPEESRMIAQPSPQTANIINQPVFSTRDGKVEFDGFINYGSPITTVQTETAGAGENAKSKDLVSAPVVTTKSGQHASQQIVREFAYPTEFQPPSPPTAIETGTPKELTKNITNQSFFAEKDGKVVQVDGFINYGTPIAVEPTEEGKIGLTKHLLEEGQEFSNSGRFDLAFKRYKQTLEIDPYNIAALRGLETVNAARAKYASSAYNEARADMVRSVDNNWELPVRKFDIGSTTIIQQPQLDQRGTTIINRKLDEIIIPRIDFQDATVREAIDFLKQRASTLDGSETDSAKKGVNIVLNLPENAAESEARITLGLTDIPLRAAIDYVAKAANLKLKVEPYAVSVVPQSTSTDVLVTKEYKVPPGFIPLVPKSDATPVLGASATTSAASLSGVSARSGAREHLESLGMTFPPGATAYLIASSNKLIVKNTQANLDLIETVVESSLAMPSTRPQATETLTAKKPDSTFSLHVSDVSFQLARDALAKGTMPEPDRIRPEEFYNAFDYNDPAPAPGEPVAARIEQAAHPFLQQRNLVRIAVKAAASGRAAGQPLRLTILLDTSGSMEREDRAVSVRQALQTLTTLLGPNDRVTLIGFARTPRLLAEQVPGDQVGKLVEAAERTPSEGGTNLEEALALASEMALKQKLPAAQNRIVLLTDGAANLGNADPVRLGKQIEKTRQQGISFDACGVGAIGLNDAILEALTRKGDGRYYFLNKPEDADASFAKQLAGAFRPAAENVKVQVIFNPARVAKYRLIGFEEHLLKREDFRNDKVQAAELSAEEAGVALYQVEPLPEGEGDLGEVFVRFRDPATGTMVERSWTMPYEANVRAFDQASPSLQLAATAALLAERLQGNTPVDLDALKPIVTNLRSHYPHQARVRELLQMFEQVQR